MARTSRSILTFVASLLCALWLFVPQANAQDVPPLLSHQGRLFDSNNEALIGQQALTFRVYDAADDTGTVLWEETLDVALENGYYSAILGQTAALPDTVFDGSTRYLGVTVGDATVADELTPRLEITSVAYALKSATSENVTGAITPESVSLAGGGTTLNADGSVNVGGATISTDGTISLGAATINTDGSIVVGNTTIGPDGTISVAGTDVIASDGSIDSSSIAGTTLADLEAGGCTTGQLPQFDATTGWSCITPSGGTVYSAGAGLALDASNQFSVDPTQVQTRVSGACSPGEFIISVNEDGTLNCVAETTYAAGVGVDITAGTISLIDTVDDDTTYAAGVGLTLTGTTFDVDAGAVQTRVSGSCASGEAIRVINADGSVTCETDSDTAYLAGTGLTLSGVTFNVDTASIQTRVTGSCAANEKLLAVNADGSVSCATDADTDTQYTVSGGLTLAGTTLGTDATVLQNRVTGACAANEFVTSVNQDGTVNCSVDQGSQQIIWRGTGTAGVAVDYSAAGFSAPPVVLISSTPDWHVFPTAVTAAGFTPSASSFDTNGLLWNIRQGQVYAFDVDGATFVQTQFNEPGGSSIHSGVTFDSTDNTIWILRQTPGGQMTNMSTSGATLGTVTVPADMDDMITYDPSDDTFWLTDAATTIVQVDRAGAELKRLPIAASSSVRGITVDRDDQTLWVVDEGRDEVRHLDRDGNNIDPPVVMSNISGSGLVGIVRMPDRTFWISDQTNLTLVHVNDTLGTVLETRPVSGFGQSNPLGLDLEVRSPTGLAIEYIAVGQ